MDLMNWLKEEVKGWDILKFIFFSVFMIFTLGFVAERIINALDYKIPYPLEGTNVPILSLQLLSLILIKGLLEETIWRFAPLSLGTIILGQSRLILIIAIISSIGFGIIHGNFLNIFQQGIGGLILSIMFLKCGGFQGKYVKAFLTTSTAHILFNIIFFGIRFMSGMPYT